MQAYITKRRAYGRIKSNFILKETTPFEYHTQEILIMLDGLLAGLSVDSCTKKKQ
jgi:hypothetical protein